MAHSLYTLQRAYNAGYCPLHEICAIPGIFIDMKFHIDIGGGYIVIESFYRFTKKKIIAPAPNVHCSMKFHCEFKRSA
jgi:hypothetical protein